MRWLVTVLTYVHNNFFYYQIKMKLTLLLQDALSAFFLYNNTLYLAKKHQNLLYFDDF